MNLEQEHILGLVVLISGLLLLRIFSARQNIPSEMTRILAQKPGERSGPGFPWKVPVGLAIAALGMLLPVLWIYVQPSADAHASPTPYSVAPAQGTDYSDAEISKLEEEYGILPDQIRIIRELEEQGSSPIDRAVKSFRYRAILEAAYDRQYDLSREALANEIKILRFLDSAPTHPHEANANFRLLNFEQTTKVLDESRTSIKFTERYHLKIDETHPERAAQWKTQEKFRHFLTTYIFGAEEITTAEARSMIEVRWGPSLDALRRIEEDDERAVLSKFYTRAEKTVRFLLRCTIPTELLEQADGETYVEIQSGKMTQPFPFSQVSFEPQRFLLGVDRLVFRVITADQDAETEPAPGKLEAIGFRALDGPWEKLISPHYDRSRQRWAYVIDSSKDFPDQILTRRLVAFSFPHQQLRLTRRNVR